MSDLTPRQTQILRLIQRFIAETGMPERTVVQWDKDDLNDLGLLKVDLLALGMLTALKRAFALMNRYRGTHYSLGELPAEDPKVYDMTVPGGIVSTPG